MSHMLKKCKVGYFYIPGMHKIKCISPASSFHPITAALPLQSLITSPLLHFLGHAQTVTPDNPIQRRTSQAEVTGALGGKEWCHICSPSTCSVDQAGPQPRTVLCCPSQNRILNYGLIFLVEHRATSTVTS